MLGLSPSERFAVLAREREEGHWPRWTSTWCGILGGTLFLLGVVFFFAANWKEMGPTTRLLLLEGAIVGSVVVSCLCGIRTTVGRWGLLAAAVFTGVLQAVFGQIYQTGADAFEVFAMWSALIVIWVWIARFPPLTVLWLAVTETALVLYAGQVLVPEGGVDWPVALTFLGILTLGVLLYRDTGAGRHRADDVSGDDWIRLLLLGATLIWFTVTPWRWIFDVFSSREAAASRLLGSLAWAFAVGGGLWYFQRKRPSVSGFSLCLLTAAVVVVCGTARWLLDDIDEIAAFFVVGLISVAVFAGTAAWIVRFARSIETPSRENSPSDPS